MSEPVATPPVESATTPAPSVSLHDLSGEQYETWRSTGKMPDPAPATPKEASSTEAASSPAEPAAQAASTDASSPPASEPGTPKKNTAETRIRELVEENKRLQRALTERQSASRPTAPSDVPRESSPAALPVSLQAIIARPDLSQPVLKEEAFYTQFPDATVADYVRYTARYEAFAVQAEATQHQQVRQIESTYVEKVSQVDPTVLDRTPPIVLAGLQQPRDLMGPDQAAGPWNDAAYVILNSDHTEALIAHFADHPADVTRVSQARTPHDAIRIVTQIETRLSSSVKPPAPAGDPVSLAPKPPVTLGKKPAQPADEVAEAIRTGDFARYRELTNRKEMARPA